MPLKFREGGKTYIVEKYIEDVNYGASFGAGGISTSAGLSLVGPAGGWVFYDRGSYTTDTWGTWRYLECSPNYTDSGTGGSTAGKMRWGRQSITTGAIYGFNGYNDIGAPVALSTDGNGLRNSYRMWAVDQNRSYSGAYSLFEATNAIAYCFGLHAGGYSDWYLPSRGECYYMWWNLVSDRVAGFNNGRGADTHRASKGFAEDIYWTSNEQGTSGAYILAFYAGFDDGNTKGSRYSVRAVRRF